MLLLGHVIEFYRARRCRVPAANTTERRRRRTWQKECPRRWNVTCSESIRLDFRRRRPRPPLLPPSYIVCEWKLYLLIKLRHLIAQRAPTLSRPVLFLIQRTSLGSYIHSTNLGRRRRCRPCCVLAFTLATKSGKAIRSSLH